MSQLLRGSAACQSMSWHAARDTHVRQVQAQVHIDDGEHDGEAPRPVVKVIPQVPARAFLHFTQARGWE